MHIAVSNLIKDTMEELLTGPRRSLLEADLALEGFLPEGCPEGLKQRAWDREASPAFRDAFWIDVIWAYRRPGGSHWGAVILDLVTPALIPALKRLDNVAADVEQGAVDAMAPEVARPRGVVPALGLERQGIYRGAEAEDVAQHLLTELLGVAATCLLPRPPRWTPHRVTTQAIRNVRRWLQGLGLNEDGPAASDLATPSQDLEAGDTTRLRGLLIDRGCEPADADLIISTRLLGNSLRLISLTTGVPYQTLWRRRARALDRVRTAATAA